MQSNDTLGTRANATKHRIQSIYLSYLSSFWGHFNSFESYTAPQSGQIWAPLE